MLRIIRDNASGLMVKIILWGLVAAFVGTIFLVWGYGTEPGQKPAAKVGKSIITRAELQTRYNQMLENIRQNFGREEVTDDLLRQLKVEETALKGLILERLQIMAAKQAGFRVSDEELRDNIANNPTFQAAGSFDRDLYVAILRNNRFSLGEYEELLRKEILINKAVRLIEDSVHVTKYEIKSEFIKENEEVKIEYLKLASASYESSIKVTDEQLSEYYEKQKPLYKQPETRKIEYLFSDPLSLRAGIKISENELKSSYESQKESFTEKEKVSVRHILFSLPADAPEERTQKLKEKVEQVLKEIKNGADFSEMAKKYSDDPGSAVNGGDMGFFERGIMLPEFEEAAFALEPGGISEPVRTKFGFHIIKTVEKKGAVTKEFADMKKHIMETLLGDKSRSKAKSRLMKIVKEEAKKKTGWEAAAKDKQLVYKTVDVKAGRPIPSIAGSLDISKRIFELAKGEKTGPVEQPTGFYMLRLTKITPKRMPDLEEIRKKVETAYKRGEGNRIAKEKAAEILNKLQAGANMDDVAKGTKLKPHESDYLRRNEKMENEPASSQLIKAALKMKSGQYDLLERMNNSYIMKLTDRKLPDEAGFDDQREAIRKKLLERKRNDAVSSWKKHIRADAEAKGIVKVEVDLL
ncbi:MAG: peptidylprolyl isomerase [bacterium]|nr:MAG: peptidylprolyl isomerase [bacterium]